MQTQANSKRALKMIENMPERKSKKEYVFLRESSVEHYEADGFVVACVDDRFSDSREEFLESIGVLRKDPKTPAGGAKVFSSPFKESDRDYHLRELELSIQLHHVDKVILFTHHDCGAYGGFGKFDNDEEKELAFHISEHRKAVEVVKERFPDLEVETYFIDDKGIIKTS